MSIPPDKIAEILRAVGAVADSVKEIDQCLRGSMVASTPGLLERVRDVEMEIQSIRTILQTAEDTRKWWVRALAASVIANIVGFSFTMVTC